MAKAPAPPLPRGGAGGPGLCIAAALGIIASGSLYVWAKPHPAPAVTCAPLEAPDGKL